MEKLIELVYYYNSHLEKDKIGIGLTTSVKEDGREVPFDKEKEIRKYEDYIISKKYGFIERLVENDKVDFNFGFIYHTYDEDELGEKYSDLDSLIMILSIQDNPIEYLCKIIKE